MHLTSTSNQHCKLLGTSIEKCSKFSEVNDEGQCIIKADGNKLTTVVPPDLCLILLVKDFIENFVACIVSVSLGVLMIF